MLSIGNHKDPERSKTSMALALPCRAITVVPCVVCEIANGTTGSKLYAWQPAIAPIASPNEKIKKVDFIAPSSLVEKPCPKSRVVGWRPNRSVSDEPSARDVVRVLRMDRGVGEKLPR